MGRPRTLNYERIQDMVDDGKTASEISRSLGASVSGVLYACEVIGITPPRKGRKNRDRREYNARYRLLHLERLRERARDRYHLKAEDEFWVAEQNARDRERYRRAADDRDERRLAEFTHA